MNAIIAVVVAMSNQINNILCFPHIFKGAIIGRKKITSKMKIACFKEICNIAKEAVDPKTKEMYPSCKNWNYGKDYFIPKPLDPRLAERISHSVAMAVNEKVR